MNKSVLRKALVTYLVQILQRIYKRKRINFSHVRSQVKVNTRSRLLSDSQALNRPNSTWVGDHQGIPTAVRFFCFFSYNLANSCLSRYLFSSVSPFFCFGVTATPARKTFSPADIFRLPESWTGIRMIYLVISELPLWRLFE